MLCFGRPWTLVFFLAQISRTNFGSTVAIQQDSVMYLRRVYCIISLLLSGWALRCWLCYAGPEAIAWAYWYQNMIMQQNPMAWMNPMMNAMHPSKPAGAQDPSHLQVLLFFGNHYYNSASSSAVFYTILGAQLLSIALRKIAFAVIKIDQKASWAHQVVAMAILYVSSLPEHLNNKPVRKDIVLRLNKPMGLINKSELLLLLENFSVHKENAFLSFVHEKSWNYLGNSVGLRWVSWHVLPFEFTLTQITVHFSQITTCRCHMPWWGPWAQCLILFSEVNRLTRTSVDWTVHLLQHQILLIQPWQQF